MHDDSFGYDRHFTYPSVLLGIANAANATVFPVGVSSGPVHRELLHSVHFTYTRTHTIHKTLTTYQPSWTSSTTACIATKPTNNSKGRRCRRVSAGSPFVCLPSIYFEITNPLTTYLETVPRHHPPPAPFTAQLASVLVFAQED